MKRYLLLAAVVLLAIAVGAYFLLRKNPEATYRTAKVERGVIVASVSATGNLSAVITVQVGTQVSGTIQTPADYSQLGSLLIAQLFLGLALPFAAILFAKVTRFKSA